MAAGRSSYIVESDMVGSAPVPGSVKGILQTSMSALTGNTPQLLIDKLRERLMQVLTDPRSTVAQSLHAIPVAEMHEANGMSAAEGKEG